MASGDFLKAIATLEKPSSANFAAWQYDFTCILMGAELWASILQVDPTTSARPPPPTNATRLAEYNSAKNRCAAAIAKAAGPEHRELIEPFMSQSDAGGMWDALEARYAPKTGGSRFTALASLFKTFRNPGESFPALGQRLNLIGQRVMALITPTLTIQEIIKEIMVFQILQSLPDDSATKSTLISSGNLDFDHVMVTLTTMDDAALLPSGDNASLASSNRRPRDPCTWCDKMGHPESSCFSKAGYYALYKKETATGKTRGRNGELKDFPSNRSSNRRSERSRAAESSDAPAESAGQASPFTSPANASADLWTADSGASKHMTLRRDWIQQLKADRRPVKLADGSCVFTAGIGFVDLHPTPKGASGPAFRLQNVLYVPDLRSNLIFLTYLTRVQGCEAVFKGSRIAFSFNGTLIFDATISTSNMAHLNVVTRPIERAMHAFSQDSPATLATWHDRFAHRSNATIEKLASSGAVEGFHLLKGEPPNDQCVPCLEGKMHRAPHTKQAERASEPLQIVCSDVHGPLPVRSRQGYEYWITFIDNAGAFVAVLFMRRKSEALAKFKVYKTWIEKKTGRVIKCILDDKGGEYSSNEWRDFCEENGIERRHTIRDTPQQNGMAERFNRTIAEAVTAMLSQAQLPRFMWADAVEAFVHVHNRTPSRSRDFKTPFELMFGRAPSVGHLRAWGCLAHVHLQKDQHPQLTPKTKRCIFIKYAQEYKGWVFWDTEAQREVVSDSAVFFEGSFPGTVRGKIMDRSSERPQAEVYNDLFPDFQAAPAAPAAPREIQPLQPEPPERDGNNQDAPENDPPRLLIRIPGREAREAMHEREARQREDELRALPREVRALRDRRHQERLVDDLEALPPRRARGRVEEVDDEEGQAATTTPSGVLTETPTLARSATSFSRTDPANEDRDLVPMLNVVDFTFATSTTLEPKSLAEAASRPDADKWIEAALAEIDAHIENGTWEIVPLPNGKRAIGSRWVFKIKHKADGAVERYKGRLVAKGYAQRQGVDYTDTFAPTARFAALRTVIALAAQEDLELESIDISTAFLNGEIDSDVYMEIPEGLEVEGKPDHRWVLKLLKGLYGIKQGPRIWSKKLHKELSEMGFDRLECDHSVFIYRRKGVRLIVPVHVDDLLVASNDVSALAEFKAELSKRFKIRDQGPVQLILGIQVERDRPNRTISLSQPRYIEEMVKEFVTNGVFNGVDVPMAEMKLSEKMAPQTDEEVEQMKSIPYRELVGKLLYLSIATRPDISYAVGVLCRFSKNPGPRHWAAAKAVLRYLNQTKSHKLVYAPSKSTDQFITYSDADLGGNPDNSRSTAGFVVKIGTGAVHWGSRLQRHVSLSSTEAEYTTASQAATEVLWMRYFLDECGYDVSSPSPLLMDNVSAIQVAKNPEHQSTMKHVHREYNWIREKVEDGEISIVHVPGTDNVADIFTKPLKRVKFQYFRDLLGLRP